MSRTCQFKGSCQFYSVHKHTDNGAVRELIVSYCEDERKAGSCSRSLVRKYYDTELISFIGPEGRQVSLA